MAGGQQPRGGGIIEGINVTPLVDITLVLLVIFIVTAKLVVAPAVPLDLPQASQGEALSSIFAVTITKDGALSIDGKPVEDGRLGEHATAALAKDRELRAVIQADGDVPHRRVIDVLDRLKTAGLTRIAFGTVQRAAPAAAEVAPASGAASPAQVAPGSGGGSGAASGTAGAPLGGEGSGEARE